MRLGSFILFDGRFQNTPHIDHARTAVHVTLTIDAFVAWHKAHVTAGFAIPLSLKARKIVHGSTLHYDHPTGWVDRFPFEFSAQQMPSHQSSGAAPSTTSPHAQHEPFSSSTGTRCALKLLPSGMCRVIFPSPLGAVSIGFMP
jgi:hypothetical protein